MTNTAAVQDLAAWSDTAIPERYRHDWLLFRDWCAATDRTALPTDPDTVVAFLDAHPATRATNRRRLTAIRWIHQHASTLVPHRTPELRSRVLLPSDRTRIDVDTIRPILQEMPTSGWTAGLVGRRDALLLVLAAHGAPYAAMERLHRRGALVDESRCLVVTLPNSVVRIPAAPEDPRTCPVAVYLRWAHLLAFYDRYPSTIALAEALCAAKPISADTVEAYQPLLPSPRDGRGPLILNVNRWGQFGIPRDVRSDCIGLTAQSAAAISAAHARGAVTYRKLELLSTGGPDSLGDVSESAAAPPTPRLSDDAYIARIFRRRADANDLADIESTFAEIERRATDLAGWIDALISDEWIGVL